MQTFLPVADFELSANMLDKRRVWKQVVEADQILDVLNGKTVAWRNHPAVLMWKGYEAALTEYRNVFLDFCATVVGIKTSKLLKPVTNVVYPPWLGWEPFHASHRGNLLRKDPEYYGQYGWTESPLLPYIWPTKVDKSLYEQETNCKTPT